MTLTRYQKDVLKTADSNHIWINAFHADPDNDEMCRDLGRNILEMLNRSDNLILCDFDGSNFEKLVQKELIIRINKS